MTSTLPGARRSKYLAASVLAEGDCHHQTRTTNSRVASVARMMVPTTVLRLATSSLNCCPHCYAGTLGRTAHSSVPAPSRQKHVRRLWPCAGGDTLGRFHD